MKLEPRAFGTAAGVTAALLFLLCAIAVAVAPEGTTAFFALLFHADLSGIARPLTVTSFVLGLIGWTVGTGLTFGFAAAVYNRVVRTPASLPAPGHPAPGSA